MRTVEASTRVLGLGHPRGAVYIKWLYDVRMERLTEAHNGAVDMTEGGKAAQAVPIFRGVIAGQTALGAERDSPTLIDTYACLASALAYTGQFKEAKRILVRSADAATRAFGPDDPITLQCAQDLVDVCDICARIRPRDAKAALTAALMAGGSEKSEKSENSDSDSESE